MPRGHACALWNHTRSAASTPHRPCPPAVHPTCRSWTVRAQSPWCPRDCGSLQGAAASPAPAPLPHPTGAWDKRPWDTAGLMATGRSPPLQAPQHYNYRAEVRKLIPHLQVLDEVPATHTGLPASRRLNQDWLMVKEAIKEGRVLGGLLPGLGKAHLPSLQLPPVSPRRGLQPRPPKGRALKRQVPCPMPPGDGQPHIRHLPALTPCPQSLHPCPEARMPPHEQRLGRATPPTRRGRGGRNLPPIAPGFGAQMSAGGVPDLWTESWGLLSWPAGMALGDLILTLGQIICTETPFGDSASSYPCLRPSPGLPGPGPSPRWSLGAPCPKACSPRTRPQKTSPAPSPTVTDPPRHEAPPPAPPPQARPSHTFFCRCRPSPVWKPQQRPAAAAAPVPGTPRPAPGPAPSSPIQPQATAP